MKALAIAGGIAVFLALIFATNLILKRRRRRFIERYEFPAPLADKLRKHHPQLREHEVEQVLDGLRQWFLACFLADGEMIGMPSRVVDDAWHEFILMRRAYTAFCEKAFGKYLHHTPNALADEPVAPKIPKTLELLRKAELVGVGALPVLFTIDSDLRIEGARWGGEDCYGGGDQDADDSCCA
jgi:hypothetical protein